MVGVGLGRFFTAGVLTSQPGDLRKLTDLWRVLSGKLSPSDRSAGAVRHAFQSTASVLPWQQSLHPGVVQQITDARW